MKINFIQILALTFSHNLKKKNQTYKKSKEFSFCLQIAGFRVINKKGETELHLGTRRFKIDSINIIQVFIK